MNKQLKEGYVYGIRQKGSIYLKVGKSTIEPVFRIAALQTGNPAPLALEFYFRTYNVDVAEQYAHQVLAKRRVNGEWFAVPWYTRWAVRRQVQLACGRACTNMLDIHMWRRWEVAYDDRLITELETNIALQMCDTIKLRFRTRLRRALSPYLWKWRRSQWSHILNKAAYRLADAMVIVWALLVLSR